MGKKLDIIGQKFGRLTVLHENGRTNAGKVMFLCKCECGNNRIVVGADLKSGNTSSCGCLRREMMSVLGKSCGDGMPQSRLKRIWQGMKKRCYNPNATGYEYYGGKGIKICKDWLKNYVSFYNWSIANGYSDCLTIDRIDTNKDYSPDNCRWTTYKVQNNNSSRNHIVCFKGEKMSLSLFCERIGAPYDAAKAMIYKGYHVNQVASKYE